MPSKYHNEKTTVDGIMFHSKKEADYYVKLTWAKKSGDILYFLRQVPFYLPGGVRYVCDFMEVWKGGEIRFVDVKGFRTPTYKMKKKIVEATYPVKIIES